MITDEQLREAVMRVGRTADGEMLYLWCQRLLCRVLHTDDDGALRLEQGRRLLASEIMGMLSRGLQETYVGSREHDRIVIFSAGPGRPVHQGANRRRGIVGDPDFQSEFADTNEQPFPGTGG